MFAFTRIVEIHGGKREKVRVVELVISNTQPLPQQPPAGVIPGFVGLLRNPAGCLPHQHNACCCGSGVHRRVPFGAHLSVRCGVVDFLVQQVSFWQQVHAAPVYAVGAVCSVGR